MSGPLVVHVGAVIPQVSVPTHFKSTATAASTMPSRKQQLGGAAANAGLKLAISCVTLAGFVGQHLGLLVEGMIMR